MKRYSQMTLEEQHHVFYRYMDRYYDAIPDYYRELSYDDLRRIAGRVAPHDDSLAQALYDDFIAEIKPPLVNRTAVFS